MKKRYFLHFFDEVDCWCIRCFPEGSPDRRRLGEAPRLIVGPFNMRLSVLERRLVELGYNRPNPSAPKWFNAVGNDSVIICEWETYIDVDAQDWLDRKLEGRKTVSRILAEMRTV